MENKPKDLEVEMFIHGAICYAYSGRCHLSDFLASRCGNLGDCAQSCRWSYNLYAEEKNNPGEMMPIETNEYGTYILSSKDLCLIKELPEVVEMGIDSLKIEGRLKTEYYLATVINTYRNMIDDYYDNKLTKEKSKVEKNKAIFLTATIGFSVIMNVSFLIAFSCLGHDKCSSKNVYYFSAKLILAPDYI